MLWQCSTSLLKEHSKLTKCRLQPPSYIYPPKDSWIFSRLQCRSICRCTSAAVDPFGRTTQDCKNNDLILLCQCSTFLLKMHSKLTKCRLQLDNFKFLLKRHSKMTNRSICRFTSAAVDPFSRTTVMCQNKDLILLWQCSTFLLKKHSKLTHCRLQRVNLQLHFRSCWPFRQVKSAW